jgi:tetratricopeptide (TPR) repeat protein
MTPITNEFGDYTAEDMNQIAANQVERIAACNDHGLQPGDAAGFSDEFFDATYTMGVRYYANRQFDKAHEMFKLLCALQPLNVRNFKAWGANYLGQQNYESAIQAYSMAYTLSATDADTSFYLGQAFYFLKDYEEARGHLAYARELARRQPALWPQIGAWSTQLLDRIQASPAP